MAKYSSIELSVSKGKLIGLEMLSDDERNALAMRNAIYIYRSKMTGKVYIGQTGNFKRRHDEHYNGTEQKFNDAHFSQVIVIFSTYFNGSALDDVESQLITYFSADSNSRINRVFFDENAVINKTAGNTVNDYRERDLIACEVILPLWEKVLYLKDG